MNRADEIQVMDASSASSCYNEEEGFEGEDDDDDEDLEESYAKGAILMEKKSALEEHIKE
ncbi:uncharacterized protein M421DRAFT_2862 [Didymella exigua CBS 183.55]|uniref:Uncharacterized protein n=1 Tax=Didymella exigua CBS 183.55 TaxID=1150837 RepID=A0A6A5RW16_9PLEO|nr:uncharacterized protein M421DRAFT_2862 [Didymella exigua CBS 183.55]KAF1931364.1 hypothetical protein M421DRAFT_2862 [Didymella exigua CBS 183.55]